MTKRFRGFRTGAALAVALLTVATVVASAKLVWATGETINGGTAVSGAPSTQIPISDLAISTSGNPTIPVKLLVTNGTLSMTTTTGLTFTGGSTGSTLYFSGTLSDVNTALATLQYTRSGTGSDTLEMSLVSSGEVFFPDNGHLYEYVSSTQTWTNAKTAAEARTKYGASGYLATVTSSAENSFIAARLSNAGWMGASDAAVEGAWKWVTGPESGTQFWSGLSSGSAVGGQYSSWNGGEPNDSGGNEDCAQYLSGGGLWNDLPCTGTTLPGYVVEYGAPGNLPSVASKNVSINVSSTSISGTVYSDSGTTNIGSGKHVNILVNGSSIGTVTTNASGQYTKTGVSLSAEDIVTVYLDGETAKGVTVLRSNGSTASGLDIWQNTLIAKSASTTALSMPNLNTANNGDSDITYIYDDGSDTVLNTNNSANYYQPSGNSVTIPQGSIAGNLTVNGTLAISAYAVQVGGNITIGGTVGGAGGPLAFTGSGTQTLTQTGTISIDIANEKSSGTLQFSTDITIGSSHWFAVYSTGTIDCNNHALTTPNFDLNYAGTYSCSAGNVTVNGDMYMRTAGGVFNVGSGTVDINGSLSLVGGTFTASTGSTSVSGDISLGGGAISAPSGTFTLDGTSTQTVSGDITFHNLTIADSTNNSTNHTVYFDNGDDIAVTGALTADGLDSNDRVQLSQTLGTWTLAFSGSGSSFTGDHVEVSNSTVSSVSGSTVSLPLNPASSYNDGSSSGWFGITIAGTSNGAEPSTGATYTITAGGTNNTGSAIPVTLSYGGTATGGSDYTVTAASIANGQSTATLTVPVVDDSLVEDTETVVVTLVSAAGYNVASPSSASRNITSDDDGAMSVTAPAGEVAEGASKLISVHLTAQPQADVVLDVSSSNAGNVTLSKASLTFSSANWNTDQTVAATAVRDYLIVSGRSATITIAPNSASPAIWQAVSAQTVPVTVADVDHAGVTITPLHLALGEGETGAATLALSTNVSTGSVVITAKPAAGLDLGNGSGASRRYTITAGNSAPTSPLSITAVDNSVVDGSRSASVTFAVSSSDDPAYDGFAITDAIKVAITDDDVSPASVTSDTSANNSGSSILLNDYDEYTDTGKPLALGTGQVVHFNVVKPDTTEHHSVTVNAVTDSYVDVTVASTPQTARLYVGDVRLFDVDKDGHNDIEITLHSITGGSANLTFRQLKQAATATTTGAKSHWSWIPYAVVALVVTTVIYVVVRKRRKTTLEKSDT